MNIFDKSYRFYEAGAPHPGICIACSNINNLWDIGVISGTNRGAYLCDTCLQDLALFAGFVLKSVHEKTTNDFMAKIEIMNSQIQAAPTLIKELTHDISNLLGEFVTSLASVTISRKPVQPESLKANARDSDGSTGPAKKISKGSTKTSQPSTKSAE